MSDLELRPGRFAAQRAGFFGFMRIFARPGAAFGGIVLLILIPCVFLAGWIAPYDPMITDAGPRLAPLSAAHLFGTDLHGRDVFSRVVHGARYAQPVGVATLLLGFRIGGTSGLMLGYLGGRFDAVGARVVDVMLGFPSIVMAIMIVSVLGVGLVNVVIAVAIADIPRYARVICGAVIVAKQNLFVESAIAMGASSARLMRLHILPTILPTVVL